MRSSKERLLLKIGALAALSTLFVILGREQHVLNYAGSFPQIPQKQSQTAIVTEFVPHSATTTQKTSMLIATTSSKIATSTRKNSKQISQNIASTTPPTATTTVTRIQAPYPFPPQTFSTINDSARRALVNILCQQREGGSLSPISGSGIVIDPRGVILTNAHVAQYVLLSESRDVDLSCSIRTGSPASPRWGAQVLYIPPVWIGQHLSEITSQHSLGTGEHDYALLLATSPTQSPIQTDFLPLDFRDHIGFLNDPVLVLSYPAEFIGGIATQLNLYPVSSTSNIQQLLTFSTSSVDVLSLGGVIEAQSGSSGGAIINAWDRMIGLITTTSEGPTTASRDLHAITLSYIARDFFVQTGIDLYQFLNADVASEATDFTKTTAPGLISQYVKIIAHTQGQ